MPSQQDNDSHQQFIYTKPINLEPFKEQTDQFTNRQKPTTTHSPPMILESVGTSIEEKPSNALRKKYYISDSNDTTETND